MTSKPEPTLGDLIESGLPLETLAALTIDHVKLAQQVRVRIAVGSWSPETSMIDRAVLLLGGCLWPELFGLNLRNAERETTV